MMIKGYNNFLKFLPELSFPREPIKETFTPKRPNAHATLAGAPPKQSITGKCK